MKQKSVKTNRLAQEKSPYLLQHAENPVNWYPWGKECFEEARKKDLPIFLSIGYSTCHWCHVMAHESFEDPGIADLLNRNFIPVKVDREERPDIDAVYMQVCQSMTGSGGWPLTVIITPEQTPIWAGTYLPKTAVPGSSSPSLTEVLTEITEQWKPYRETFSRIGAQVIAQVRENNRDSKPDTVFSGALLKQGARDLLQQFDPKWGGFGTAPKFPSPHNLLFLLTYSRTEGCIPCEEAVKRTLDQMYRGGLFDHIGGGFSRYSTDEKWLVPHFEKMLYDNALLTLAYLEYFSVSRDGFYKKIAGLTIDYVLRELTSPEGGFYCGQDADSDGTEGKYYLFSPEEIRDVLGADAGEFFCGRYHIDDSGNFLGKSIPNLLDTADYSSFPPQLQSMKEKLYQFRLQRTSLHKDDKILTSWNGLMISALSRSFLLSGNPAHLDAAERAAAFVVSHLTDSRGKLMVRWRDGQAAYPGHLDDYAFFISGLLDLYDASLNADYLTRAVSLAEQMTDEFSDEQNGGFFLYGKYSERLVLKPKEGYDGAMPSGNSAAARIFVRLFHLTGEVKWRTLAARQCSWIAGQAKKYPAGYSFGLLAIAEFLAPSVQLVCASASKDLPEDLLTYRKNHAGADVSVLFKHPGNEEALAEAAPFTEAYPLPKSGAVYYFCKDGTCSAPMDSLGSQPEK